MAQLTFVTLGEAILLRRHAYGKGITFVENSKVEQFVSYGELYERAVTLLGFLQQQGLQENDELIFQIQDNESFVGLFFACQLGGIVPVPLSLGKEDGHRQKVVQVFKQLRRPFIAVSAGYADKLAESLKTLDADAAECMLTKTLAVSQEAYTCMPGTYVPRTAHEVALIQFSSGSTGSPKGVVLTHHNIITNVADLYAGAASSAADSMFTWMPLTHDMGLICNLLQSVLYEMNLFLLATDAFVRSPELWIDKVSAYGATQIYSPNFGYSFFLKFLKPGRKPWDLSRVRIIYNGAEQVSDSIFLAFYQALAPYGLRKEALLPVYGLAEASVGVAVTRPGEGYEKVYADRNSLQVGQAVIERNDAGGAVPFVSVGRPLASCQVRITNDGREPLPERMLGHVEIKGPNVTRGYYGHDGVGQPGPAPEKWLQTGDLGFVRNGLLYITGRSKEVFIKAGQNYYLHDFERTLYELPQIELGKVVACAAPGTGGAEELLVFIANKGARHDFDQVARQAARKIQDTFGFAPDHVVPVTRIPKTTSGKVQRFRLVEEFLATRRAGEAPAVPALPARAPSNHLADETVLDLLKEVLNVPHVEPGTNLFELNASSLTLTQLCIEIGRRYNTRIEPYELLETPVVADLVKLLNGKRSAPGPQTENAVTREHPATRSQVRIWLESTMSDAASNAYKIVNAYEVKGTFHPQAFVQALGLVVDRYEILRTVFRASKEHTVVGRVKHRIADVAVITPCDSPASLQAEMDRAVAKPFDLENGPLLHVTVFCLRPGEHVFLFQIHHIISDGWSVQQLSAQLWQHYAALSAGQAPTVTPLPAQFRDFAARLNTPSAQSLAYWADEFKDGIPVLKLAGEKNAPKSYTGDALVVALPGPLVTRIRQLTRESATTEFCILTAALAVVLSRYAGEKEIVVATDSHGRSGVEEEEQIGYFIKTLLLKLHVEEDQNFLDLARRVKAKLIGALRHADVGFEQLLDGLRLTNTDQQTYLSVLVLYQNFASRLPFEITTPDLSVQSLDYASGSALVDLLFQFNNFGGELKLEIRFDTQRFSRDFVAKLGQHFVALAALLTQSPGAPLREQSMLLPGEEQRLDRFGQPGGDPTPARDPLHLLAGYAALHPHKVALVCRDRMVTYQELERITDNLAQCMRREQGLRPGDRVCVYYSRSENTILILLAILKAGLVYVPIDHNYPAGRVQHILADCGAGLLITDLHADIAPVPGLRTMDAATINRIGADGSPVGPEGAQTAYILYTSGTTGQPKGVVVSRASLADYVATFARYFSLSDADVVASQSSVSFDTSFEEIFPALSRGGTVVIMANGGADVEEMTSEMVRNKVTLLSTTPLVLHEVNRRCEKAFRLRAAISGGDVLRFGNVSNLMAACTVYNTYGPTEATVCTTYKKLESRESFLTIGAPVSNRKVFILNDRLQRQPVGVPGEICIGGKGVAAGYLNNPELTAGAFIRVPELDADPIYRTGDYGYWSEDGEIVFTGRKDAQTKVRGFRVELAEVENALLAHEAVNEALVLTLDDAEGGKSIAAFLYTGGNLEKDEIRAWLGNRVPYYMLPQQWFFLDAFPRTTNGKVDRKKLLALASQTPPPPAFAPADAVDLALAETFARVLGSEPVAGNASFFSLGGNSLHAIQLINEIRDRFGVALSIREIFQNPHLRELRAVIAGKGVVETASGAPPRCRPEAPVRATAAQQKIWTWQRLHPAGTAYNLFWSYRVEGTLVPEKLAAALAELIRQYEILRTSFYESDGQLFQKIHPADAVRPDQFLEIIELPGDPAPEVAAATSRHVSLVFNLSEPPLLKITWLKDGAGRQSYLLFSFHHIIIDGWSLQLFIQALKDLYHRPDHAGAATPAFQYRDYVAWQESQPAKPASQAYWETKLAGNTGKIVLPFAQADAPGGARAGMALARTLDAATWQRLTALAHAHSASPFSAVLAVLHILVYKYTRLDDITLGTVTSGREHRVSRDQIGYFLKTLYLRTRFSPEHSFVELMARIQGTLYEAFEHQDFSVEDLQPGHHAGTAGQRPFFNWLVLFQNYDLSASIEEFSDTVRLTALEGPALPALSDLVIECIEKEKALKVSVRWNAGVYDKALIGFFLDGFEAILDACLRNPAVTAGACGFVKESVAGRVLQFSRGGDPDFPALSPAETFAHHALHHPGRTCLVTPQHSLTYGQLNAAANQFAAYLTDQCGLTGNELVAVLLPPGEHALVALLAILKCGAAWVPLNVDFPRERNEAMLRNLALRHLVTTPEGDVAVPGVNRIVLAELIDRGSLRHLPAANPVRAYRPGDIAYVLHTSGTTGLPKPVAVTCESIAGYITAFVRYFGVNAGDAVVQQAPYTFDTSLEEIFSAWYAGAKLVIAAQGARIAADLSDLLRREKVTVLSTVPAVIARVSVPASLRLLISGGDELKPADLRHIPDAVSVFNTYGPTEATICATFSRPGAPFNIGGPVSNKAVYVLDEALQLVPPGVVGRLYLGGKGLALGYLNQVEETHAKFGVYASALGEWVYDSGDYGYWDHNGCLHLKGRNDQQVKVHGQRIELAEIENAILRVAGVGGCVVTYEPVDAGREKQLVAYHVSGPEVTASVIRRQIARELPHYMIPSHYVPLAALPVTYNGKVDRNALRYVQTAAERPAAVARERSALDAVILGIWQRVLKKPHLQYGDNFFEEGGNSFHAYLLMSEINRTLQTNRDVREIFIFPTPDSFLANLEADPARLRPLVAAEEQDHYPLSREQQRLWIVRHLAFERNNYNISVAFRIEGPVNDQALLEAIGQVVAAHAVFGGRLVQVGEEVRQSFVSSPAAPRISYHTVAEAGIEPSLREDAATQFDLLNGPAYAFKLYRVTPQRAVLSFVIDHIFFDGWSVQLLFSQIAHAYRTGNPPAAPAFSFTDVVWSQGGAAAEAKRMADRRYWLDRFAENYEQVTLPTDYNRPPVKSSNGKVVQHLVGTDRLARLEAFCQEEGVTLFSLLFSAFNALLYRYTELTDLVVGVTTSGRTQSAVHQTLGFFARTLALRTKIAEEQPFAQFVRATHRDLTDAYVHQDYPFDELVNDLKLPRDVSRSPLFDILLVFHERLHEASAGEPFVSRRITPRAVAAKYDVLVNFITAGDGLQIEVEYNADLYRESTVQAFCRHLVNLLEASARHRSQALHQLDFLDEAERRTLRTFAGTPAPDSRPRTFNELFADQVARYPHRVALSCRDRSYTYQCLDVLTNQVARLLQTSAGLTRESRVALLLDRNEQIPVILVALQKIGCCYVPIDPNLPPQRIAQVLSDVAPHLLIGGPGAEARFAVPAVLLADALLAAATSFGGEPLDTPVALTDPAYVIYTSGSTGQPKGVVISTGNLARFLEWARAEFSELGFGTVLSATSYVFDLSCFEYFFTLTFNKHLRLLPATEEIGPYCRLEKEVLLNTVPSVLNALLDQEASLKNVRGINLAGEAILPALMERLDLDAYQVRNLYGPSEDTTYSTCYRFPRHDRHVTIGRPIAGTQIELLDRHDNLKPLGMAGEICIKGEGLALGYLNLPAVTHDKFGIHRLDGQRYYRTGDLGKWDEHGNLLFLGRKDNQVKLRGYRIELSEIEAVVARHPLVGKAVAILHEAGPGGPLIACFYTSATPLPPAEVRSHAEQYLPAYMVPSLLLHLEALPYNANGKVDRPQLVARLGQHRTASAAPAEDEQQRTLQRIWQESLGVAVGIDDNFFAAGGNSLTAIKVTFRVNKALGVELPVAALFRNSTVRTLAAYLRQHAPLPESTIARAAATDGVYEASNFQKRLWVLSQFEGANQAYLLRIIYRLEGPLDLPVFEGAWTALAARHEILRSAYRVHNNVLCEVPRAVARPGDLLRFEASDADCQQLLRDAESRINVEEGPLFTLQLLEKKAGAYYLIFVAHHLIVDGWSMQLLWRDFIGLYTSMTAGAAVSLSGPPIQFRDYVSHLNQLHRKDALQQQRQYWLNLFAQGVPPVLNFPTDKPRPAVKTYNGASHRQVMDQARWERLNHAARQHNASPFVYLLSVLNVLLYKYTGQTEIVVGTPVSNRKQAQTQDVVGPFLNTIVLKNSVRADEPFGQLVQRVNTGFTEAFENQEYTLDLLIHDLNLDKDTSSSPLFDIMVAFHDDFFSKSQPLPGITLTEIPVETRFSKFDLTFDFLLNQHGLVMTLEYNTDLFSAAFSRGILDDFGSLLENTLAAGVTPVRAISCLDEAKRAALAALGRGSRKPVPPRSIIAWIEEQSREKPHAVALICPDGYLTYSELNARADAYAHFLRNRFNLQPQDRVGIACETNAPFLLAVLAALKLSCSYLPFHPETPVKRLESICRDAGVKVLVTEGGLAADGVACPRVTFDLAHTRPAGPGAPAHAPVPFDNPFYTIYTSGSTGTPKGVTISNHSFLNLLQWYTEYAGFTADSRSLLIAPVSFDLAQKNLFGPLVSGGTLVMTPGTRDYFHLTRCIYRHKVTHLNCAPSAFYPLVADAASDYHELKSVRQVILGGETINKAVLKPWAQSRWFNAEVINSYGPTECTDVVAACRVDIRSEDPNIPIGKPVDNVQIYILDPDRNPVPVNVPGEIFLGGVCVSAGYINDPALTGERFIQSPFGGQERLYATGDIGRWTADGSVLFSTRVDGQVKIAGHRIEIGEVLHTLRKFPGVLDAVVVPFERGDGSRYLAAYLRHEPGLVLGALRAFLEDTLPAYMVPAFLVPVEAFPVNAHGKIDVKQLKAPAGAPASPAAPGPERSLTPLQQTVLNVFCRVLGVPTLGPQDDLFVVGGDSLTAILAAARLSQELNVQVEFSAVLKNPTALRLARHVENLPVAGPAPAAAADYPSGKHFPLSKGQLKLWLAAQLPGGERAFNITHAWQLTGPLDAVLFEKAFVDACGRHDALRLAFAEEQPGVVRQTLSDARPGLRVLAAAEPARIIDQVIGREKATAFDLHAAPLYRATLVQGPAATHFFVLTIHHIITDGWSIDLLLRDVTDGYEAYVAGTPAEAEPVAATYQEYIHDAARADSEAARQFWTQYLQAPPEPVSFPADHQRPAQRTFEGKRMTAPLPEATGNRFLQTVRQLDGTPYTGFLSLVFILLRRYTQADDITLGTPLSGRFHPKFFNVFGYLVRELPVRVKFDDAPASFAGVVAEVSKTIRLLSQHQHSDPEAVYQAVGIARKGLDNPLFNTVVTYENFRAYRTVAGGLHFGEYRTGDGVAAKFDLVFHFRQQAAGLEVDVEYNTAVYADDTIAALIDNLTTLMASAGEQPAADLHALNLLSAAEKARLEMFSRSKRLAPPHPSLLGLLAGQVARHPNRIAYVQGDQCYTYRQLDERAGELAGWLAGHYGGDRLRTCVGIQMAQGFNLAAAMVAVLKLGGTSVFISPQMPPDRLLKIGADCALSLLLVETPRADVQIPGCDCLDVNLVERGGAAGLPAEQFVEEAPTPPHYIIYTSGSTGDPKGVMVQYDNLTGLAQWHNEQFGVSKESVSSLYASTSFDAFLWEFWPTLLQGGVLVQVPEDSKLDVARLAAHLVKNRVTHCFLPTAMFELLATSAGRDALSRVTLLTGGEALRVRPDPFARACYNNYGITEATVVSSYYDLSAAGPLPSIPIGRPVYNTNLYIVDRWKNLLPVGCEGEILIGGTQLAEGYVNNPELTHEKFGPDVFSPFAGDRVYRSGDFGKWTRDGNVLYAGRKDRQIKLNGRRIEIGEVVAAFKKIGIENVYVQVAARAERQEDQLVAFYSAAAEIAAGDLEASLKNTLPAYMVPGRFVFVQHFPLNSSGKIDYGKLAELAESQAQLETFALPAREALLAAVSEVLGIAAIELTDNYFALGGDSIKALQVISRLHALGYECKVRDIFTYPNLGELLLRVRKSAGNSTPPQPVSGEVPLSPVQLDFFGENRRQPSHYNQGVLLSFPATRLSADRVRAVLKRLCAHHDALRLRADRHASNVRLVVAADMPEVNLTEITLSESSAPGDLARYADLFQSQLNIWEGKIVYATLFRGPGQDHLLLIVHHLAVDGVSWRILLGDFHTLYQAADVESCPLPPKTDSVIGWNGQLVALANAAVLLDTRSFWRENSAVPTAPIRADYQAVQDQEMHSATVRMVLDEAHGNLFLNPALPAGRQDLLVTAIALAVKDQYDLPGVRVEVEGTGRDFEQTALDVSNTVGWFTCLYPLNIDLSRTDSGEGLLGRVRNLLARVPMKGISYGVLKHFTDQAHRSGIDFSPADIRINFLGEFTMNTDLFRVDEAPGSPVHPLEARSRKLEITALISEEKELILEIAYNRTEYKEATMKALIHLVEHYLKALVHDSATYTPAAPPRTYHFKQLTATEVDHLFD